MAVVYIEARPRGRGALAAIEDFVVENRSHQELVSFTTQEEAITWAKNNGHTVRVAFIRHLPNKLIPDHWREV
jgi:hypothetical protein